MSHRQGWAPYDKVMDQVARRLVVPDLGPCLEFTGYTMPNGYGAVNIGGTPVYAHRIVAEQHLGPAPVGKPFVLHACDNPPCVEVKHLKYGTHLENMEQAKAHGRTRRGETHWRSKLTKDNVYAIRADTRSSKTVAAAFGVTPPTIDKIRSRQRWGWLPEFPLDEGDNE